MVTDVPGISSYIDHTNLKPVSRFADLDQLCREAVQYSFAAVCVPPYTVERAVQTMSGTGVKTATVIGFPLGYAALEAKKAEVRKALTDGADELDIVINLLALKNGQWDYLEEEMRLLMDMVHDQGKMVKVIVESGLLSRDEIRRCCAVYGKMGIDFMKTSTGYAEKGASAEDVLLMRKELPSETRIKASGGIRTYAFARELVEAGASRIGCSASLTLVAEEKAWLVKEKKL
jgi:deoxyribose-phosphate aldolase